MKLTTINLVIPGLWALLRTIREHDSTIESRCPSLARILRRSDVVQESTEESETRVLQWLGLDDASQAPVAALERLADNDDARQGWWMRADPVNLVADRQFIVMQHPDMLGLDDDEARQLVNLVNSHFSQDGWQLEMASPGRWYLRLSEPLDMVTTPTWRVAGKDIDSYSPSGPDGLSWHASLNELQMLLYSSPVTDRRIEQGHPPVTGLWVWGGGSIDKLTVSGNASLWGDSFFLQGIARLTGLTHHELPTNWDTLMSQSQAYNEAIVWQDQAKQALMSGNIEEGINALQLLESNTFEPLLDLLKSKQISTLNICDTPGHVVQISAKGIGRWWRRRQPVPDINL